MSDYKPEYKPGDEVLVKHTQNKDIEEWLKGTDRIVTVSSVERTGVYRCLRDHEYYNVSQDEIAGYGFKYGQEIEVSDNGENWFKTTHLTHIENARFPHIANYKHGGYETYKYARPIEQVKEDAKLTLSERSILLLEDFLRMSKEDTDEIHELFLWLEQSRESLKNTMIK